MAQQQPHGSDAQAIPAASSPAVASSRLSPRSAQRVRDQLSAKRAEMVALQREMSQLHESLRSLSADFQRDLKTTLQQLSQALPANASAAANDADPSSAQPPT